MPSCPIEVGKFEDSESIPYDAVNEGELSDKAMGPPSFAGKFFGQMRRDEFTKLMQFVRIIFGRFRAKRMSSGAGQRFLSDPTGLQLHLIA